MSTLSAQIYSHSGNAGGDADDSYYSIAKGWRTPGNVKEITEALLDDIDPIQTHIDKVKTALDDFEKTCETNSSDLQRLEQNMAVLLNDELGNIDDLQGDINEYLAGIAADQEMIDNG
ncbi:hypothetical protein BDW66DRAFT_146786 [Aspergillus desertorum]